MIKPLCQECNEEARYRVPSTVPGAFCFYCERHFDEALDKITETAIADGEIERTGPGKLRITEKGKRTLGERGFYQKRTVN